MRSLSPQSSNKMLSTISETGGCLTFNDLPFELQHIILTKLSVSSLLKFAQTNRHNYHISTIALTTLHLAIFPRKIHGVLAYLNACPNDFVNEAGTHQIVIPQIENEIHTNATSSRSRRSRHDKLHISPKVYRERLLTTLTSTTGAILSTSCLTNLRTLTLHTYCASSSSTNNTTSSSFISTLATQFPHLQNLTLNFTHPYIHDTCLPAHYWTIPDTGSPEWNSLGGLGKDYDKDLVQLRSLQRLEVNRAGITAKQLLEWIKLNPQLNELKLNCVSGVDLEFVEGLVQLYCNNTQRVSLSTLDLSFSSPSLVLHTIEEATWVSRLISQGLERLSLRSCKGVDCDLLTSICEEQEWMKKGLKELDLGTNIRPNKSRGALLGAMTAPILTSIPATTVMNGSGSSYSSNSSSSSSASTHAHRDRNASLSDGEEDALTALASSSSSGPRKGKARELRPAIEMDILEVDPDC